MDNTGLGGPIPLSVGGHTAVVSGPTAVIAVLLAAFLAYSVYLLHFHPLSKFPGPALYAISPIPISYAQLVGKSHLVYQDLHRRYGPVVRASPNELSFVSDTALRDIYSRRKGRAPLPKDPALYNTDVFEPGNISIANEDEHARIRHALAPAFSAQGLQQHEPVIQQMSNLMLDKLAERAKAGELIDIHKWYVFMTFDVMGDLGFGEAFGSLAAGKFHEWIQIVLDSYFVSTFVQVVYRFRPADKLLAALTPRSFEKTQQRHADMSREMIQKRMRQGLSRPDFSYHLIKAAESGQLSTTEAERQSSTLILAGSESTASGISFTTWQLLNHPDCLRKLTAEVEGAFQSLDQITLQGVYQLKYLHAVVQEALRLLPPTPNGFPRETPPEGAVIDGDFVPGKTSVNIPQWSAFRSELHFSQPDKFIPERWLGDERFTDDVRKVCQPFSVGPRSCIGQTLAYHEIKMVIAKMVWKFDMSLAPKSRGWLDDPRVYFIWLLPPLFVSLKAKR